MSNPIIKVTCFKETGKYYTSQETELKDIHYVKCPNNEEAYYLFAQEEKIEGNQSFEERTMANYIATERLITAIKTNLEEVLIYAPVTSGFRGQFYYVIEVLYPDSEYGFCFFHMNKTFFEPMAMPA